MKFKKFKKFLWIFLLTFLIMPTSALAYAKYVYAGGDNIGIELHAKGVMVIGTYQVNDTYPAVDAGLKNGDMIIKINDQKVESIEDMVEKINQAENKEKIKVTYLRNMKTEETTLKVIQEEEIYKTGLYVKDSITGIGTLSFIDPETKRFGALGHEILEKTTGELLEIKDGKIFHSTVTDIVRSEEGVPGEKNARYDMDQVEGVVFANTEEGIFGDYTGKIEDTTLYEVATPEEVHTGSAKIRTVVDGEEIQEYEIELLKVEKNQENNKSMLFEITDQDLLKLSGGVVSGMSGSPIIQDNKIVGAVTHVVVDHPKRGYGIFITNMLEESEK